ncbi:MAG: hypothetical protein AAGI27_13770, partial [Pseudomonadota bacterium]
MSKEASTRTAREFHNTKRLGAWTAAWLVTLALVAFGPVYLWDKEPLITSAFIVINLGIGGGMIIANIRFVADLDELQKQIHLEAMGISLGVGLVVGLSYSMLDITNLVSWNAEISHLVFVQGITYLVAMGN